MDDIIEQYISALDTQRFGFKIAKIDDFRGNPGFLCKAMLEMDVKLIISKIRVSECETINTLEALGFRIKDVQLKYRYDLRQFDPDCNRLTPNFILREANPGDIPQLIAISEEAFRGYGHYAADTRLDKEKCLEIYMDWTRRSCIDKNVADKFFLAEQNNKIVGFQAFKIREESGEKKVVGVLGAVSVSFRGNGVFPALIKRGSVWGVELNLKWQEHKVLTTNLPVNRSFSKMGFKIVDSMVTMHGWLDK